MATPAYLRYLNENATRNKPLSPRLSEALGFLPDLGITAEVFSGGQDGKGEGDRRTGSVRHDHGGAADVFFTRDGRRLDWANPEDRPVFEEIVRRGKANGLTGFGAGPGYMQAGSMHVGFGAPGVWGAGGSGANAPDWLRQAYGEAPASDGAVSGSGGQEMAYGGAGNDTLGSNFGGLGGLGGMQQPQPETAQNFMLEPVVGNIFGAISQIAAGANPGDAFAAEREVATKRQILDRQYADAEKARRARITALMSQGYSAEQAATLANDATAATMAVDARNAQRKLDLAQGALDRDASYMRGLTDLAGGEAPAGTEPAAIEPAAPQYGAPQSAPTASEGRNTAVLARTIKDADDVIASTGSDAKPEPLSSFSTGHTTVDALMGKRSQLVRALAAAPSDDTFQRGKLMVEDLDKRIEAYTPTATVKDYLWDMRQRQDQGMPMIRLGEWKVEQSKAGASNVTVGAEKTYDTTVGKGYGDLFNDLQKEARSANSTLGALNVMEQSMSNDKFYSGFGAEQLLTARRAASALGLDPEGISDMETFNAQTKGAALAAMGGSLGAGFSNADRSFVEGQVPSFENTPDGNRKLIDVNRKLAKRKQEIAAFARDYARKNEGRLDMGFDDALSAWAEANPLFPPPPSDGGFGPGGGYKVLGVR